MACPMLVLLLWAGVPVSAAVDLQKRVIGGQPCQRPYHVRLRAVRAHRSTSLCGGSLISDQWILTAAHCLQPGRTMFADLKKHPEGPAEAVEITAKPVIYTDEGRSHDIMLLQLPNASDIHPIALPDCKYRPKIVEISGHGATAGGPDDERKRDVSPTLHCAAVDVVSCEDLMNTLQKEFNAAYKVKVNQHLLCGQTPGKDVCYGDSGGGAVYEDKIYGVISFLVDPANVCRKAAAFMDLCDPEYAAWIKGIIS